MNEQPMQSLFQSMVGASFDEFTMRFASFGLRFSKPSGSRQIVFKLESRTNIAVAMKERKQSVGMVCDHLFNCLEESISEFKPLDKGEVEVIMSNGMSFVLWDSEEEANEELFAIFTENWPEENDRKYFYISPGDFEQF
jgi:hypothetical protein